MQKKKRGQVDFGSGRVLQNILQSALPMLVAQILNLLYNVVDRIYIARIPRIGTAALGGVGLCFPLIILITAFTNLYGMGGAPLLSMELGRGDRKRAGDLMNTAFFLLMATGLVITLLGEVIATPLLLLFGASSANLPHALAYLRIYLLGTVFSMAATGMNPYVNAQGFPGVGMLTVTIGALSNIVLDPLFIFVFHLGVQGAAIATCLSQALSALFVLRFLRGGSPLHLHVLRPAQLRGRGAMVWDIVSLGTSAFIMQFTNALATLACNVVLSRYGALYVSIMTIVSSVRQMLETPVLAIAEGASPVLSFNYGAERPEKVRQAIRYMAVMLIGYTAVIWALIEWQPAAIISVFSSDDSILQDAIPALHLYFFAFVFMALQYTAQTTFKALNKKRRAIFFSLFRKVVLVVPLTFLLPGLGFAQNGAFMAEPISNVIGGLASFTTMCLTLLPELREGEKKRAQQKRG